MGSRSTQALRHSVKGTQIRAKMELELVLERDYLPNPVMKVQ